MKMTFHASNDRSDRLEYIIDTVGIGEVIAEMKAFDYPSQKWAIKKLTTTGVMIVVSEEYKTLVTAYIASLKQVKEVWSYTHPYGDGKLPNYLYRTVISNQKYFAKEQP